MPRASPPERPRPPTAIDPAFDPSNRDWPASCASKCWTVAAPAGLAKMLDTPLAAASAPPSAAARGTVDSCSTGAPAAPLEPSIVCAGATAGTANASAMRSEEHTSELQSLAYLVCRLLL